MCARICLDSNMTSSLDGLFPSVHSCHAKTADEEAVLIITTRGCRGVWFEAEQRGRSAQY